jgi:hypothetical protein
MLLDSDSTLALSKVSVEKGRRKEGRLSKVSVEKGRRKEVREEIEGKKRRKEVTERQAGRRQAYSKKLIERQDDHVSCWCWWWWWWGRND